MADGHAKRLEDLCKSHLKLRCIRNSKRERATGGYDKSKRQSVFQGEAKDEKDF